MGVAGQLSKTGDPTWEIAQLFPLQGSWSVTEYLAIEDRASRLVEFHNGHVEVLPVAGYLHQTILMFIVELLLPTIGRERLLVAPIPVRLGPQLFREPDVFLLREGQRPGIESPYIDVASVLLAVEIISPANRKHVVETKFLEYAAAGIAEYWIVDPTERSIRVCSEPRPDGGYATTSSFAIGDVAISTVEPAIHLPVLDVVTGGRGEPQ